VMGFGAVGLAVLDGEFDAGHAAIIV
jgi:hypothetical protein